MKSKKFIHSIVIILIFPLVACQTSNAVPSPTEAIQENIIPSNTPAPTPVPLTLSFSSPEWEGTQIDSICVDVTEEHDFEDVIDFLTPVYHQKETSSLLRDIGFKTGNDSAVCDAILNIAVGISASHTTYTETNGGSSTFDCLTYVNFSGLMVLTADGHSPLYTDIGDEVVDEPYIVINGCSEIKFAVDLAWTKAVLKGLKEFMGSDMVSSLFKSEDTLHRSAALGVSEILGPQDIAVLPDLLGALKTDTGNASQIASGIQNMGPSAQQAAQEAIPTLVTALKTSYDDDVARGMNINLEYQQGIIEALGKLGPGSKEAVPLLIQMLQDQAAIDMHDAIVQTLGNIGPDAAEAIPELQKISETNSYAVESLRKIEPLTSDVIATLMEEAKNYKESPFAASLAMETLGKLNAESADILPFLISAASDSDPNVASNAIRELGKLGPVSAEIFPILKGALSSSNERISQAGAAGLGDFGPQAVDTIPLLISVIKNGDQYSLARMAAVDTLGRLGHASPEVVSILTEEVEAHTSGAQLALEQLGPEARAAVPALIKALEGENISLAYYAYQTPYVRALISITGEYHGYKATDWQAWWDTQPK